MGNGMDKIVNGLYLGNFRDSRDTAQLTQNCITHIVSVHDNAKPLQADKVYLCLTASDTPLQDLTQYFSQSNDFIHKARLDGGGVLVHCLAGVSRSSTIIVAYVMSVTDLDYRSALDAVRGARSCALPNFGFLRQLLNFQRGGLEKERQRLLDKFGPSSFSDKADLLILLDQFRESEAQLVRARGDLAYTTSENPRYVDGKESAETDSLTDAAPVSVSNDHISYARKAMRDITIGRMNQETSKQTEDGLVQASDVSSTTSSSSDEETHEAGNANSSAKNTQSASAASHSSNDQVSSSSKDASVAASNSASVEVTAEKHITATANDMDGIAVCST